MQRRAEVERRVGVAALARSPRPGARRADSADEPREFAGGDALERDAIRARAGSASGRAPRRSPPAGRRRGRAGSPARCAATETQTRSAGTTGPSAGAATATRSRRHAASAPSTSSGSRASNPPRGWPRRSPIRGARHRGDRAARRPAVAGEKIAERVAVLVEIARARRMRRDAGIDGRMEEWRADEAAHDGIGRAERVAVIRRDRAAIDRQPLGARQASPRGACAGGAPSAASSASAKRRCSSAATAWQSVEHGCGRRGLVFEHRELGNVDVPLDQRRTRADPRDRPRGRAPIPPARRARRGCR